ncbi:phosphoribosylformylglycinamidine cyclo-ligase [Oceanidesulfovibrio marinus]|uniref:Phosphoribosylformylglycinamidine cyclo-ligase n=1 Tax=Oceanidesulfovibrio marinus TaxID=370038 RepID=A0A6P1ZDC3_9BACT|nr:phosphoribosylformylglycinamidine cyclo-ligase [Oceanidesulfovibrio marinus]QJT11034.1 phosphoribosylformylglycinamidine cyclo-ligase [Oceanidesulfovibrio marinus]TVM31349.1 phosphoribosylformylglycinamidine cyclo-ligase [Oceanidesulfovibrio marinus]
MPERAKSYAEAGVSLERAESLVSRIKSLVADTHTKGVVSDIGGFGGLFRPDFGEFKNPLLVASTDGVGTKLRLAFAFNRHATVGVDLVAMSVNDVLVHGANPLFFLDYFATGRLDVQVAESVIAGVAAGCKEAGCALLGGESAEMPDMYPDGEYDLAGFCVGMTDDSNIVDGSSIRVGDAVIGLASSGIHSNGYSLVRKVFEKSGAKPHDTFPGEDASFDEVLLRPTAIYVRPILNLLRDFEVRGMAHITGGGFYENIPRVLPRGVQVNIQYGSWDIAPVFTWLQEVGEIPWHEMLNIFNCGIGYICIVDKDAQEDVLSRLSALGQKAYSIGTVEKRAEDDSPQVVVQNLPS